MKNNFNCYFKHLILTTPFKVVIIILLLGNLYVAGCLTINFAFVESIINILNYPYYSILLFLVFLFLTFKTNQYLDISYYQLIRLGTYQNKLKFKNKQCIYIVSVLFFMNLICLLLMLILFNIGKIDFNTFSDIGMYILVYIIKLYIFVLLFCSINMLLFGLFNNYLVLIINLLIVLTLPKYMVLLPRITIDSGNSIPIIFLGLLSDTSMFDNFTIELCAISGHMFLLSLIYDVLYKYCLRVVR